MPGRIDSLTYIGFGVIGAGTTGEIVKNAAKDCAVVAVEPKAIDIMDVNLFFGYLPGYELNLTGVIAMLGAGIMLFSIIRGNKAKKKREASENWIDKIVK